MERADKAIGRACDDGAAANSFPCLLVVPFLPQAGHHHVALVCHRNGVWLLLWLLPFVEPVSNDQASLALLPGVTKCSRGVNRLGLRVDRSEANLDVLRPPRNKAPAHLLRDSLAVLAANSHQHWIG